MMHSLLERKLLVALLVFLPSTAAWAQTLAEGEIGKEPEGGVDFHRDIRPVLSEYCFHCHGPDAATREADLRLDTPEALAEAVRTETDDSTSSLIAERILTSDPDLRMPPLGAKQPTQSQRGQIERWLRDGAAVSGHWSFTELTRPELPSGSSASSPIDLFVNARLQHEGIRPNRRASSTTLLRRMTLAVTGLLPTVSEIKKFDEAVRAVGERQAIDRVLDRLFASPAYGEHMAYPWLEAARYADTDGYQNDRYRYQDAWRDWVIRACNEKMPYSDFVTEQLAGDLLPDATLWQQVATGFGRNHRINSEDGSIEEEWRVENVVDRVDTFGTVFLGLTVGCARCHDHKYDPISQQEYYELFAYFNSISEYGIGPNNGNTPPFVKLPSSWPRLSAAEDRAIVPDPVKLSRARKDAGNGLRRPQAGKPGTVMVMHELEQPRETYLLLRGQYSTPDKSRQLSPSVPASLNTPKQSPSNRLELAGWLLDRRNPLTARVAVNRIWQQYFGAGLVESSENFGAQGALPSHPKLLDWLALELIESGWNTVHIQRMILTSDAFARSSVASRRGQSVDPANRFFWRGPKSRLTAPELRDAALLSSGLLIRQIGGPSVKPYMPPKIWSSISNNKYEQGTGEELFRRSLYTYWRRTIPPPTMVGFNAATRETCSVRNEITNTPLQALTLLNNKTFVEAARNLAVTAIATDSHGWLPKQVGPSPDGIEKPELSTEVSAVRRAIKFMSLALLTREPTTNETELLLELYGDALADYCSNPTEAFQFLAIGATGIQQPASTTTGAETQEPEPQNAKSVGDSKTAEHTDGSNKPNAGRDSYSPPRIVTAVAPEQIAALTAVAAAIMNLDEAIHRE